MSAGVVWREEILRAKNISEDVEVFLTLLPALIDRLGFYTEVIRGETSALTTPVTRSASTPEKEVDLRLIPRLLRLQETDDATSELHLEVRLRRRSVRQTRRVDLDVAAAVGLLLRKSTTLRSARRSSDSRTRRPSVPNGHTPDRLFEAINTDELDW